jgi:uncharacterized membrane protein YphA (DoxX/SURF4 family)
MNIVLWVVQWILSILFLAIGAQKLFAYEMLKQKAKDESPPRDLGFARELAAFIGISEVAGAIGLILPASVGIAPVLTTLAAIGLAVIMILAIVFHLRRKEPVIVPLVFLALAAFVVVGRGFN